MNHRYAVVNTATGAIVGRCDGEIAAQGCARMYAENEPGIEFVVCRLVPIWSAIVPVQPVIETRIVGPGE